MSGIGKWGYRNNQVLNKLREHIVDVLTDTEDVPDNVNFEGYVTGLFDLAMDMTWQEAWDSGYEAGLEVKEDELKEAKEEEKSV